MSRPPDDMPHDEHLRAALRHAPDAQLQAPREISAQILAAAHRAAAEPRPAPAPTRKPWWAFGAPRRLGASGAFATLLLAGVVGVLWHGRETPGPQTEAQQEAAAPVVTAPMLPAPAASALPATRAVVAPEPPPKTTAAAAAPRPARIEQARADDAQREAKAAAALQEASRNESRRRADAPAQDRVRLAKEEAAPAAAAPQDAPPAVAAAPAPPPPPPLPAPAAAPAPAAVAGVDARAPAAPAPAAAGRAVLGGQLMARPRPNAPWMDALAAGPAVQWTVDGEARAPTSSWLYALAEQTQGRWRPVAGAPAGTDHSVVLWQRGNELLGRLWLGDERVRWCDAQGRCEEALLDAGVGPVLRKGLAR